MQALRPALVLLAVAVVAGCQGKDAKRNTVVLKVVGSIDRPDAEQVANVLRERIDALGIRDADVRPGPNGRITITSSRLIPPPARPLLTRTGALAFYDLEGDLAPVSSDDRGSPLPATDLMRLAARARAAAPAHEAASFLLFDRRGRLLAGPEPTRSAIGSIPQGAQVVGVPAHETVVSCTASATTACPGAARPRGTYWYVFEYHPSRASNPVPRATGADLKLSAIRARVGTLPSEGNAFVQLGFKREGNRKFHELTRREAFRGRQLADAAGEGGANDTITVLQYAQHFAIVLDNELQSTPYIDYKQNPDGIDPSGNGAIISNLHSFGEAKDLAIVLRSGALPFRLVVVG